MDIYSAKTMLNRIIDFVNKSSSSSTKMYVKSKDRYLDLKSTCYDLICAIDQLVDTKFTEATVEVSDSSSTSETATTVVQSNHTKSQVIANYHVVLKKLAEIRSGYHEVDAFAHVLLKWYEARFISHGESEHFKCNSKYMGRWILTTAIGYGNALEGGSGKEYLSCISTFAENLSQDFSTSKYVLPWDIYKATKNLSGESVSLTGVVLWEILYDLGLNVLDPAASPSYLASDAAKVLYDQRSEDAPYYYNSYKLSEKVRQRVKLTAYSMKEGVEC